MGILAVWNECLLADVPNMWEILLGDNGVMTGLDRVEY
jgi:hypothetical protein